MTQSPLIRHILVPHDFSETADKALAYALTLAEKLGSRVTVLHVYEIPAYPFPEGPAMTIPMAAELEKASATALEAVVARSQRPGMKLETQLRQGAPWREIDEGARELKADLVVMATHGRKGLARALLGSVAEKVVRTAPCPVLTVHPDEGAH
jgi:nucleotide-binding universal stress UspA family protein